MSEPQRCVNTNAALTNTMTNRESQRWLKRFYP
jgi:hypothetical protein